MSSPTFWDEAARAMTQAESEIRKGAHRDQPVIGAGEAMDGRDDSAVRGASPIAQIEEGEGHVIPARGGRSSDTTLSYLPNRTDPFADLSAHAYLAGAEYAPNRFGDIGDYMRKKEIKVQTQNRDIAMADPAAANLPQIFKDLSFYINGNTSPPMEELRKMILQRGGEVRPVLRSKGFVKYIIAPMLTQMKFKLFQNYKVVREAWITESCREGKLLDWTRWKLQVQGGWEEEGRKGLEGFFKGEGTQRPKREPEESADEEEEEVEEREEVRIDEPAKRNAGNESRALAIQTQAEQSPAVLLRAHPEISQPHAIKGPAGPPSRSDATAQSKEQTPQKAQRPEGAFDFYSTKSSNEDAARLLKDQEWRLKNTAERGNEGGFIDGYYQNSRLHHLSTWKAELRVLVAAAQRQSEENSLKAPSSTSISPFSLSSAVLPTRPQTGGNSSDKVIFHVDFDCFFVSCGLATRPHLRGKPAVVCHSTGGRQEGSTSEIASASYEARAKGVRNGMSLGRARTLVGEDLETIPYEFDTYKKFSLAFYTVLMGYADELQAVSVDEALIDVTGAVAAREAAPEEAEANGDRGPEEEDMEIQRRPRDAVVEIAEKIRDDIRCETGCEVSIGISHNVLLSKLATRRAKPAGVYHLVPAEIPAFLAPLDVEDFPSVGWSIRSKIEEKFGTTICGELMEHSKGAFRGVLGPKTGEMVWGYLRGMDDRKLEPHKERKSISAEMNYGIRFRNDEQAEICVRDLAAEVAKRMKQVNAKGRLLTLKLMKRHPEAPLEPPKFLGHGWCETFNKSSAVGTKGGASTDDPEILGVEAVKLLRSLGLDPVELRGVGIQMTNLDGDRPEREAGQGVLSFAAGKKRDRGGNLKDEAQDEGPAEGAPSEETAPGLLESTENKDAVVSATSNPPVALAKQPSSPPPAVTAGPSRILGPAASSDGIDPEFLAALPLDIQQELKQDNARTRAARKAALAEPKPLVPLPFKPRPAAKSTSTAPGSAPTIKTISIPPTRTKDTVGSMVPHWSRLDHTINKEGRHSAAHISKQLRPKIKTQLKAGQIADLALYSAWNKAKADETPPLYEEADVVESKREVLDLTESPGRPDKGKRKRDDTASPTKDTCVEGAKAVTTEAHAALGTKKIGVFFLKDLQELGIDSAVFAELPEDIQQEVVAEERRKHRQRSLLHRPADTSRIRAKEREADRSRLGSVGVGVGVDRTVSLSPSRSRGASVPPLPQAREIKRPCVVRPETKRPSMLNATKLPDVLDTITKWIESRGIKPPAERDARKVEAYLVKLVDPTVGLGGVEAALECLQWMRVILSEKWEEDQGGNDTSVRTDGQWAVPEVHIGIKEDKQAQAGKAWWTVWRRFVDSVSRRSTETLGAPLRL